MLVLASLANIEAEKRNDDVSLETLNALVQQQAATIAQQAASIQQLQAFMQAYQAATEAKLALLQSSDNNQTAAIQKLIGQGLYKIVFVAMCTSLLVTPMKRVLIVSC
jgi:hypothetical protein